MSKLFYEFVNSFDNEDMIEEEINQKNVQDILQMSLQQKNLSIKKKALNFIASHFYI